VGHIGGASILFDTRWPGRNKNMAGKRSADDNDAEEQEEQEEEEKVQTKKSAKKQKSAKGGVHRCLSCAL
jgi:hypothetical protein